MNRPLSRLFTTLIMLVTGALPAFAQAQTAQIPASFHGTYSLTFHTDHPQAPLPDGAPAELVLAPGGALCIADYILTGPQLAGGSPDEAYWTAADVGVQLAVSGITGSFNDISVLALDGSLLGEFTGSKTSDSTTCGSIGEMPQNISDIDDVFSLAEQAFADLFPTNISSASLRVLDGFIYRHYMASGVYVGINISDNNVYLMGGPFGDQPENVGTINSVLDQLYTELDLDPPGDGGGLFDVSDGNFTLTVSGSVSGTSGGVPFSQQYNPLYVIDSTFVPDAPSLEALEGDLIVGLQQSMQNLGSNTFSNISINGVDVGENRVFYSLRFDAQSGDTSLSYVFDYEYVRN